MVGMHEGRIRFIVNANHSYEHIDKTVKTLQYLADEYQLFDDQKNMRSNAVIGKFSVSGIKAQLDTELA